MDLSFISSTVGNNLVRNLVYDSSCISCSLTSFIIGEVEVNNMWHKTKWLKDGANVSGIPSFKLNMN